MRTLVSLLIISCLLVIALPTEAAVDFSGELTTEFSYSGLKTNLPPTAKSNLQLNSNSYLQLSAQGLLPNFQYDLQLEGSGNNHSGQLNRGVITTTTGPTLWELGYRAWHWGQGFSFSPTYPLPDEEAYTGLEANTIFSNYNLTWGAALDTNHDNLQTSWLRLNSLLATSDYTVVVSYLKDSSELNIPLAGKQQTGLNLGFNYSQDFLNGFEVHSGINIRRWQKEKEIKQQYLIGTQYNTAHNQIILLEYYQKVDKYLTFVVRNQGGITANWHWEIRENLNLTDYGEVRSIDFSYSGFDNLTPQLEIDNFAGPDTSHIKAKPVDWRIEFKLTADLF